MVGPLGVEKVFYLFSMIISGPSSDPDADLDQYLPDEWVKAVYGMSCLLNGILWAN